MPGEYRPQLAVPDDDLNPRGDNQGPLDGPHALKESLHEREEEAVTKLFQSQSRASGEAPGAAVFFPSDLVIVGDLHQRGVPDDGHDGDEESVGAADHGGEAGPEERLQQRVDPPHEEQGLNHPDLVILRNIQPISSSSVKEFRAEFLAFICPTKSKLFYLQQPGLLTQFLGKDQSRR